MKYEIWDPEIWIIALLVVIILSLATFNNSQINHLTEEVFKLNQSQHSQDNSLDMLNNKLNNKIDNITTDNLRQLRDTYHNCLYNQIFTDPEFCQSNNPDPKSLIEGKFERLTIHLTEMITTWGYTDDISDGKVLCIYRTQTADIQVKLKINIPNSIKTNCIENLIK